MFIHSAGPKNKFYGWILQIATDAKQDVMNSSGNDGQDYDSNPFFAETLHTPLIEYLSLLPLIGNIMNTSMGSTCEIPTSSSTENDFDILKNDLMHASRDVRVDTFVQRHLTFTKGRLIGAKSKEIGEKIFEMDQEDDFTFQNSEIERGEEKETEKKNEDSKHDFPADESDEDDASREVCDDFDSKHDFPTDESDEDDASLEVCDDFDGKHNKFENWGGQNEDGPRQQKKFNRCKFSILNAAKGSNQYVKMLPNVHVSTKGVPRITALNMCAFDSIYHYYAVGYCDVPSFKARVDINTNEDSICALIIMHFTAKEHVVLNKRNSIIAKFFNQSSKIIECGKSRQIEINCECTLSYIFNEMSNIDQFLYSYHQRDVCLPCDLAFNQNNVKYVSLKSGFDITNLQPYIQPIPATPIATCTNCKGTLERHTKHNQFISVETDMPKSGQLYSVMAEACITDISPEIEFDGYIYTLNGIICYRTGKTGMGHYFLIMRRQMGRGKCTTIWRPTCVQSKFIQNSKLLHYVSLALKIPGQQANIHKTHLHQMRQHKTSQPNHPHWTK